MWIIHGARRESIYPGVDQVGQHVHEMTYFPYDSAASDLAVAYPVVGLHFSGIHTIVDGFGQVIREEAFDLLYIRGESPIESYHEVQLGALINPSTLLELFETHAQLHL